MNSTFSQTPMLKRYYSDFYDYLIITLSAISLNLALIKPQTFSFLVFLFVIPIYYLFLRAYHNKMRPISFVHGFVWGLVFFTIHFWGYLFLFQKEANGIFRIGIPIVLAFYCALYAGFWFLLMRKSISFLSNRGMAKVPIFKTIVVLAMPLFLWSYLYFSWVRYGIFWIFGEFVGYPFAYPLLPLAYTASTIGFMGPFKQTGIGGKSVFLVLLLFFSISVALFLWYKKKKYLIAAVLLFSPFLISKLHKTYTIHTHAHKQVLWYTTISKFGHINPIRAQAYNHPLDCAQEIYYDMVALLDKNPQVTHIVMPESSCNFCLNKHPYVIDLWFSNIASLTRNRIHILMGAPYKEGGKLYNALYWLCDGTIRGVYKKTRLMAFAEYVPKCWQNCLTLRNLFCDNNSFFSPGESTNQKFVSEDFTSKCAIDMHIQDKKALGEKMPQKRTFKPLICSDLFLGKRKEAKKLKYLDFALVFVNDYIFPRQYLRNLMFLYAKLEGLSKYIDILYVGYYGMRFLPKDS